MTDSGNNGNGMTAGVAPPPTPDDFAHLEQRVRRLEDAVVQLQDTRPLEERVVERLAARQQLAALRDADKVPVPAVAMHKPDPPPVAQPIPTAIPVVSAPPVSPTTWLGLFFDMWTEIRSMVSMYFDRRYRMRWTGLLVPPALLIAILTSVFWFPGLPWLFQVLPGAVAAMMNVPVVLVLSYFFFRLLAWEAKRYRDAVADLPRTPRL